MKIENPQAFPLTKEGRDPNGKTFEYNVGMTLRDYFAAKAIPGCIALISIDVLIDDGITPYTEFITSTAYKIADAMLKERLK